MPSQRGAPSSCQPHGDDVPQPRRGPRTAEHLRCGGMCPTSAPSCSFILGAGIICTEIRREGRPAPLHPKSCDGDCCWLGDAAQIHEVTQFFPSVLLLCFPPLFVKTEMTEGGG